MPDKQEPLVRVSPLLPIKTDHIVDYKNLRLSERKALTAIQLLSFKGRQQDAAAAITAALDIPRDATIGQSILLRVEGDAGTAWSVAAAFDRGSLQLGALGEWLLDPATSFLAYWGTLSPTGIAEVTIPVPNDPSLRGATVFMQGLVARQGAFALTNSVYDHLR